MPKTMILCDFDGTTAANDVGNLLFRTFADARCHEIVRSWKAGEIDSRTCLMRECEIARVSRAQLDAFCDAQGLDPYFADFVRFCRKRGIEVGIASDGLDYYIHRILQNHGFNGEVAVFANRLEFEGPQRIRPEFPYFSEGCGQCGNCKGYHVRRARATHDRVVYVGDGLSDRCGAEAADIVFAKRGRDLLTYCREKGLPHHEYDDFGEVLRKLHNLV